MDSYEHQIEELMAAATKKIQEATVESGRNFTQLIGEEQLRGVIIASLAMASMVHTLIALRIEPGMAVYLVAEYIKVAVPQANKPTDSTGK